MPTLNEYLGGIFSSITDARVMADVQTVQVAEQYAKHDLLKHFAVPRMRIGDIELTIPIAIEGLSELSGYQLDPIGNEEFKRVAARELARSVGYTELPPIPAQRLRSALDQHTDALVQNLRSKDMAKEMAEAFYGFSKAIAADLFRIGEEARLHDGKFPGQYKPEHSEERMLALCTGLIRGVVDKPRLDQLSIIAESHRLREQRPEDIVRIRMTIGEDGMEWQTIERDDGTVERKLLPE